MVLVVPRGVRNNNPGNIRRSKDPWQGLAKDQTDRDFFRFEAPVWGIRAIARILITYYDDYGFNTVRKVIRRYSPPVENDTGSYMGFVSDEMGVGLDDPLNMQNYSVLRPMVEAIIAFECSNYQYAPAVIDEGLKLAGVVPPLPMSSVKSAVNDPKVIAATVVASATMVQQVIGSVSGVWDSINELGFDPRLVMLVFGVAVGIVAAWFVIDWLRRRRGGMA